MACLNVSDIHYKLLALAFILAILVVAAVNSMNQSRELAGSSVDDANNATAALKNISLSIFRKCLIWSHKYQMPLQSNAPSLKK